MIEQSFRACRIAAALGRRRRAVAIDPNPCSRRPSLRVMTDLMPSTAVSVALAAGVDWRGCADLRTTQAATCDFRVSPTIIRPARRTRSAKAGRIR